MSSVLWTRVQGVVIQGYRVASAPSKDYPYGTIEKQKPVFKALGLNLDDYFNGTLNISIQPFTFQWINPKFTFHNVAWTDLHPPERFSFSRCGVIYQNVEYEGWVYYPHPETKRLHFHTAPCGQNPSLLEIIARPIPNIQYGDNVEVALNPEEITAGRAL